MATSAADPTVEDADPIVRVFGGMGVDIGGKPVGIGGVRQRRLLALLAVRAGEVLSVDWLAEHMWRDEDRPTDPIASIRTYVSRLRASLPDEVSEWIATAPSGYRLAAPATGVEHTRLRLLRSEAASATRRGDPAAALRALDEALGLWRGDPFRELEDLVVMRGEVERLHVDRLEMLEERWQAALALGRHTQITGELSAFTADHGLRDRAARQHALALHRSGRTADALAALAEHRALLAEETGMDPSSMVLELERQLYAGDPALDIEGVGRPLRGYRLLEESGRGAFSVVWRGVQPSVDRPVAIKQIRAELASQPDFIRRFEAEARLVARVEHPHVVPLVDFWRDPDSAYLVMRWMQGGTLARRLDDGWLSLDGTLTLADQIGRALVAAHLHGVVHRDVKPANILFDEHRNAYLGDFGIAMSADGPDGAAAQLSLGTPEYAAPEQIRREPLGPAADVFSLGVVLFECLTGTLPFGDVRGPEVVERQLHQPTPSLAAMRDDVPRHVSEAIARATAKDVADRYGDVLEFVAALSHEAPTTVAVPSTDLGVDLPNPYVGLRAFDEGDVEEFFGRDRLVDELAGRLRGTGPESRCVMVVGASGSGKSSAVRAGLVPALRSGAVPRSQEWFTTTMVPGPDPYASLETALLRVAVGPPPALGDQLRDGRRGILRGVRRCLGGDDRVVLVVDQFEEVFTAATDQTAEAFLTALAEAIEDPQSPLVVVATIRADHYHRPLEHPAFAALGKRCTVPVTPLAGDELEEAIVGPARARGVRFEPGLVARIAAESAGRIGSLPLLQYALAELFDRRDGRLLTSDAYDEVGGLTGALSSRAEQLYADADADERAAVRRLFGRLTDPSQEALDTRRRARLADVGGDDATAAVLERFGRARLLTFDREAGTREPTVEVAHEALLSEWPRLVGWLRDDRELLRTTSAIAIAADSWEEAGRPPSDLYRGGRLEDASAVAEAAPERLRPSDIEFVEQSLVSAAATRERESRRLRRLRRLVAGTAAALVAALVAGGVAIGQQRRADEEATRAQAAADEAVVAAEDAELATLVSRSAALADEDPDVAILLALEAHRRSPGPTTESAVLEALGASTTASRISSNPALYDPVGCAFLSIDVTGRTSYGLRGGQLAERDIATGEVSIVGDPPVPCVQWRAHPVEARRVAFARGIDARYWYSSDGQSWGEPVPLPPQSQPFADSFAVGDNIMLIERSPGETRVFLVDGPSGEQIGSGVAGRAVSGPPGGWAYATSSDGATVLVPFFEPIDPAPGGRIAVMDGVSGEQIGEVLTSAVVTALDLDEETGEIVAALEDGRVVTYADGRPTGEVRPASATVRDVRVLGDGRLVVAGLGEAEVFDRATGRSVDVVPLRSAYNVLTNADGLIVTLTGDDRIEVYDLDLTALVEQVVDVPSRSLALVGPGDRATVWEPLGDVAELVDLATGERRAVDLSLPDSRPDGAQPEIAAPTEDGVWTLHQDPLALARWVDGALVERVDLPGAAPNGVARTLPIGRRWVVISAGEDTLTTTLVDLTPAAAAVVTSIDEDLGGEDTTVIALPSAAGGMHVATRLGTVRTYDADGNVVDELATRFENPVEMRPAGAGAIAIAAEFLDVVAIVDPDTRTIQEIEVGDPVFSLGFSDDGARMVVQTRDGAVRLWDVADDRTVGLLYRSRGPGPPPVVDDADGTVWVSTAGRLLQLPIDPGRWIEKACASVGRSLTQAEWDRWVPGGGEVVSSCGSVGVDDA